MQFEILRKKTPSEKLEMVGALNNTMRTLMMSGIAMRHPEFNEEQRWRKLMDRLLGEVLAESVFGLASYPYQQNSDNKRRTDD